MATDEPHAEQERPCRVCGQSKPPADFTSGTTRVRRHRVCRECRSRAQRAYRDAHPEQRERFNQWRRALHRLGDRGSGIGARNEQGEEG